MDTLSREITANPVAALVTDLTNGRVLDVNDAFLQLTGLVREEVVGRLARELDTWLDPGQYAALRASLEGQGAIPALEMLIRTKGGVPRLVHVTMEAREVDGAPVAMSRVSAIPARDEAARAPDESGQPRHWQSMLLDPTGATQQTAVQQARTLMETSLDGIIATDGDGRILEFNPAAERMFDIHREGVLGQALDTLIVPPERGGADAARRGFLDATGSKVPLGSRVETSAIRADGGRFPVELTMNLIEGSAGPMFVGYVRDITQRGETETALRASEARFRALVQNSYDVITVITRDGSRTYASPSIERLLGFAPAALIGADALSLTHPDDRKLLASAIEACLAGARQTPILELRFRHADGSWRTFESVGTNLLDDPGVNGIVFNSRDVTQRTLTEAALQKSEKRFRSAFDNAPIGLAIVGANDRFREVNRSLSELVGFDEGELLHLTLADITFEEDVDDSSELSSRLWSGAIDKFQLEKRFVHKDGHIVWVDLTASAVDDGDGQRYAIFQIEDVTARRRLDVERATMLASERAYTRQLRDLADMRADLSRMVSHELRAPVAALRMMTSVLATGELPPARRAETLAAIQSQINQLDRLTADVATMSTAEREDFSVQLHAVPLALLISGAAAFAKNTMGEHPISIAPVDDVRVWCDPDRINQVLRNLLDNIARHTPPGAPVEIRAVVAGGDARIEIADRGPGIAEEDRLLIFEKFGRGRDAARQQRSGAGLGLYLSQQIMHAHGSELTVRSGPDGGAVFAFDLRVAR